MNALVRPSIEQGEFQRCRPSRTLSSVSAPSEPENRATVVVSADIRFTEIEVNAMDILGLHYTLTCQVLNQYLIDDDPRGLALRGPRRSAPAICRALEPGASASTKS